MVASGGEWANPDTGEIEPKLHLHWRLQKPARGDDRKVLEQARRFVIEIVASDPTHAPISHPIRWPGSIHRKGAPKLCRIVAENSAAEIDLAAAHAALKKARGADAQTAEKEEGGKIDWVKIIQDILTADNYHEPISRAAAKLLAAGTHPGAVVNILRGWMEASAGPRDARYQARFDDIPRQVDTAVAKFGAGVETTGLGDWDAGDDSELPPPRGWLLGNVFCRQFLSSLFGDGAVGKTAVRYAQGLSLATGR